MSLKDRLRQAVPVVALGMAAFAPTLKAQTSDNTQEKSSVGIVQTVESGWQWNNMTDKAVYDSLPAQYKKFANKSFLDRLEMKEEWEQKDYIKRDKERTKILEKDPMAKLRDISPNSVLPDDPLSAYPTGHISFDTHILQEQIKGNLTPIQAKMAKEVATLGRPLSTLDSKTPYAEQLKQCGFDVMADLVNGKKEHDLSKRDHAIFVAQIQESEMMHESDKNFEARRDLKNRLEKENNAFYEANNSSIKRFFSKITPTISKKDKSVIETPEIVNGKSVYHSKDDKQNPDILSYSILDEITLKVADKIRAEEQLKSTVLTKRLKTQQHE